jgi:uncharacterized protein with NRDE domain
MCLVVLAVKQSAEFPLIVLGNRDEFHSRPTRDANWWADMPDIVGGRDLQAGGTWLALHRNGRFATVTNFRDAKREHPGLRSRGHLVTEFLRGNLTPMTYLQGVSGDDYAGFNLLVADKDEVAYLSNRDGGLRVLPAGIYGLSNAILDSPWDKVVRSKAALASALDSATASDEVNETQLLRILDDRRTGPVDEVTSDRLSFSKAHALTAPFITLPDYGTRCSTIVLQRESGKTEFLERRFDAQGKASGESRFSFATSGGQA